MNIIECNKTDVYALGDIHGLFKAIRYWITTHDLRNCAMIFCGDFGLGFEKLNREIDLLSRVNKSCEARDIDIFVIRGNHDNPAYYNTDQFSLGLSRIRPVSDYTIIKTPEHNILCLGGAVSVDREWRITARKREVLFKMMHMSKERAEESTPHYYWPDEKFVYDDSVLDEILNSDINIDVVCSHSAPSICWPLTSGHVTLNKSKEVIDDSNYERAELLRVWDKFNNANKKIDKWIYGHYHFHHFESIEGTAFVLLDMGKASKKPKEACPGPNFDMYRI